MKIALITDTHYGVRGDSTTVLDYQKKFTDNVFFPYLKNHNIKHVIHLGDLFDRRKFINFNTLYRTRQDFLTPLSLLVDEVHIIAGNHDVALKNTNEINSLREVVVGKYNNIYVYSNIATHIEIGSKSLLLVPWLNPENEQYSFEIINQSKAKLCFGHFHLQGFEMERGNVSLDGHDRTLLNKFKMVFSGHFHHKSSDGKIHYLGAPFQQTWADYGCKRGFHILDLKTNDLEFIENPFVMFNVLEYNDTGISSPVQLNAQVKPDIIGTYVKINVVQKNNPYFFDQFVSHVETLNPYDIKIIHQIKSEDIDAIDESCENTMDIVYKSIDLMELNIDKQKLKDFMNNLHHQAINMEVLE